MQITSKDTKSFFHPVELSPRAKESLEALAQERGMTQSAVLSRLVVWFLHEEEAIQRLVVGDPRPGGGAVRAGRRVGV